MKTTLEKAPEGARMRGLLRLAMALVMIGQLAVLAGPAAATFDDDDEGYEEAPPGGGAPVPPAYVAPANGFDWRAGSRYSEWTNAWHERGYVQRPWEVETYNPEYVNPTAWPLYMMGCQTKNDFLYDLDPTSVPKPTTKYKWEWEGHVREFSEDCNTTLMFPAEGTYYVKMSTKNGTTVKTWTHPVQVKDLLIEADRKLALEYPTFFTDDDGSQCFDDLPWWLLPVFPFHVATGWDTEEIDHARTVWAPKLNNAVHAGAVANGFTYVGGIDAAFRKHGWCADNRYINTSVDAGTIQGDESGVTGFFSNLSSTGTAHPNAKGYAAYANLILDHLPNLVDNVPPVGVGDKIWASPPLPTYGYNVLDNDYDEDPDDTLTVRLVDKPLHGKLELTTDGWAFYKPDGGYTGPDQFRYELTDGVNARFVDVDITVEPLTIAKATVAIGTSAEIGGLIGPSNMAGPYVVVFDNVLPDVRGELDLSPDQDLVLFTAPLNPRRRGLRLPYTVYSATIDRLSPDYGRSVRGLLKVKIVRRIP